MMPSQKGQPIAAGGTGVADRPKASLLGSAVKLSMDEAPKDADPPGSGRECREGSCGRR